MLPGCPRVSVLMEVALPSDGFAFGISLNIRLLGQPCSIEIRATDGDAANAV